NVIWVTDGTPGGTHPAASVDVRTGSGGLLTASSLGAFFSGNTPGNGWQIFRTDGPEVSSHALTSVAQGVTNIIGLVDGQPTFVQASQPGSASVWRVQDASGAVTELTNVPNYAEFAVTDHVGFAISTLSSPDNARQVESFRADAAPPTILPVPPPSTYWYYPHHMGSGSKLACAETYTQYVSQNSVQELYCSDGTVAGTHRPVPPALGTGVQLWDFTEYSRIGDRLLFYAPASPTLQPGLWVTDGTDEGTFPLLALVESDVQGWMPCSGDQSGGVYFLGSPYENPDNSSFLWYTDGTASGTYQVKRMGSGQYSCAVLGTTTGIHGTAYLQIGTTLYRSDGTSVGTFPVAGAPTLQTFSYTKSWQGIASIGRWLVFFAPISTTELGIWRLDLDPIFSDGFDSWLTPA
ncbi:MAG: hypothetical protein ABI748_05240, partial [Dokdonella sp.]